VLQNWEIGGKSGHVVFPKGEVVYQTKGVVIEPVYVDEDRKHYIFDGEEKLVEVDDNYNVEGQEIIERDGRRYVKVIKGRLLEVLLNGYNGYCYRQDGK